MGVKNGGKTIFGSRLQLPRRSKYFVKIGLSGTISEINAFMQKFKMAAKNVGENNFWEKSTLDECVFVFCVFAFYAKIQDGRQKWQENNFWQWTLRVKKFRRNWSISHRFEDQCVFAFYAENQGSRQKMSGKMIFGKSLQ